MMKLTMKMLRFIQHLEAVEVEMRYPDLPRAFVQLIIQLPKDEQGKYPTGAELTEFIMRHAPEREWFVQQDARLNAQTDAMQALPRELQELAPLKPLGRVREWWEDENVQPAQLVDGEWVRPVVAVDMRAPHNLAMLKQRLIQEIARVRYEKETGGISVNGVQVLTDRESQFTVSAAYARATSDPTATVRWKAVNGFVTLDAAAIIQTGAAVFNHVQTCFSREGELREQIEAAGTLNALLRIDIQAGWGR